VTVLLLGFNSYASEVMALAFGASTSRFAAPAGQMRPIEELGGKRIATSYHAIVEDFLAGHGIEATVVRLDGAVEPAIQLGVVDAIADVVETGSTLQQA